MVEMRVAGIALDAASRSPIVLLRDPSGRRQVPIWIDQAQAQNILTGMGDEPPARPLSHDLMVSLLDAGGLELDRVIIHAIEDSTFRAVLKLRPENDEDPSSAEPESTPGAASIEIDARPSDAIALAVRTGSSIWMLEEVVADASIPVDAQADAQEQDNFRRFLDNTSPADLVRHLSQSQRQQEPPQEEGSPDDQAGPAGDADDPGASA